MGKLPGFTFYPGDWLKDPELRRCSKAAKGVWIDMLAVSFECADRGVFSTGGESWTDQEIAAAIGGDIAENLSCISELLRKGVARRNSSGAIFSARMVRDEQSRSADRDKKRRQRCPEHVPPVVPPRVPPLSVNESETVIEVGFELEAFDFEEAFNKLCEIYPRSDRSYIAQTNFIKAVESVSKRKKLRRSEAAAYILSRTEIYVSKCKFISGLTKYLDSEIYDQNEAMWETVVQSGTAKQRAVMDAIDKA